MNGFAVQEILKPVYTFVLEADLLPVNRKLVPIISKPATSNTMTKPLLSVGAPPVGGLPLFGYLSIILHGAVILAQSMTMGKPTSSVVGNPQECGLVPKVGNFPPNGTTSASAAVQWV